MLISLNATVENSFHLLLLISVFSPLDHFKMLHPVVKRINGEAFRMALWSLMARAWAPVTGRRRKGVRPSAGKTNIQAAQCQRHSKSRGQRGPKVSQVTPLAQQTIPHMNNPESRVHVQTNVGTVHTVTLRHRQW